MKFGKLGTFGMHLFAVLTEAWDLGVDALDDGKVTSDEVEDAAGKLSDAAGDVLHIEMHGQDIVNDACQRHLVQGVALLGFGVASAMARESDAEWAEYLKATEDKVAASRAKAAAGGDNPFREMAKDRARGVAARAREMAKDIQLGVGLAAQVLGIHLDRGDHQDPEPVEPPAEG